MKVTSEQIQKLQDLLDKAECQFNRKTKGIPLYELNKNDCAMANYWDGKKVALGEALYILKL